MAAPLHTHMPAQDVAEYWEQVLNTVDKATASKLVPHLDVTQVPVLVECPPAVPCSMFCSWLYELQACIMLTH